MNAIELANQTGLHKNTIYKMIQSGEIKAQKEGKSFQVDEKQAKEIIYSKYAYLKPKVVFNATQSLIDGIKKEQIELFKCILTLAEDVYVDYEIAVESANKSTTESDREKNLDMAILNLIDDSAFPDLFNAFSEFLSNDEYIRKLTVTQRRQMKDNIQGTYKSNFEKYFFGVDDEDQNIDRFTYFDYENISEDD